LHLLGDPQAALPVVLVAGTNGKTSTARMVDALLRAFGLRVGRYTSPHLESVTERIALDGVPVDAERFVASYAEVAPYLDVVDARHDHPLSFFEVLTAMAYATFADAPVDVAVVEVGLGGTWDATNLAHATVAVVTPVALDHQAYLGETLPEIAGEKAGVVKAGSFAVLAQQPPEAAQVLLRRCAEVEATVAREGFEFGVLSVVTAVGGQLLVLRGLDAEYDEVFLPLHGAHQAHNAAVALAAVEALLGGRRLDADLVRAGLAQVRSPGRLEVLRRSPTVLVDAAHNPAGARALAAALTEEFAFDRLVGVVAVLADKDARGILEALEPVLTDLVVTRTSSPRALDPDRLAEVAVEVFGADRVSVAPRLADALDEAVALAEDPALGGAGVLVTGSVVTAGEARRLLRTSSDDQGG
ncbi:MAG: bifunctional folylpolyglutamate synthase/dihydrofolate synthase, partial [Actinomycetia bacterium]|nr:bifunctional folylpolyglutamate synthase/dihydrofolate synthase [Actinomycetes bacterium]